MVRKLLALAAASLVVLALAAAASAAAPPTLTGESFQISGPGTTSDICSGAGGTMTATFAGTAVGPYAGTYTETIALTYAASVGGVGAATGSETFSIASGDTVTGSKQLSGVIDCFDNGDFSFKLGGTYSATISTPSGAFHDEGSADAGGTTGFGMFENFTSSLPAPTPLLPTSKDECKKGGWQSFGVFKNQGDCVSFVATAGKNPPG